MSSMCCGDIFKNCCKIVEAGKTDKVKDDEVTLYFKSQYDTCKIKFDDCVCKDKTRRKCDFLLKSNNVLYLVELKGKKTKDAVEQISSTLDILEEDNYAMLKSGISIFIGLIVRKHFIPQILEMDSQVRGLRTRLYKMSRKLKNIKGFNDDLILKSVKSIPQSNEKRDKDLLFLKKLECSRDNPIILSNK